MFIAGNFLLAIGQVLEIVLELAKWIVIIRALISWVNPDPYNPIVMFLHRVTDPLLAPIQRAVPPMGGMDFSPILLLLAIVFLQTFLVQSISQVGMNLRLG